MSRTIPLVDRSGAGGKADVTPAGIVKVEKLAAAGCTNQTIAKVLGVSAPKLVQIRRRQPEVEEAIAHGRAAMEDELVDILMSIARDPKHRGQSVAAMFLLKTRSGYREGEVAH